MWKILQYFISILIAILSVTSHLYAQDTISIPLKIKAGIDIAGPAIYFTDNTAFNAEGYFSADLDEKKALYFGTGFSDYNYSQYNYEYKSKGVFIRAGVDFNLLHPKKAQGKYWFGIGLRYGLSRFTSETPYLSHTNLWGMEESSIGEKKSWGHFVEVTPGVRAEIFENLSIGWTISLRKMIYSGGDKNLKPVYLPGFGNASKSVSSGISYFIVWNIPYKKIDVILNKETQDEDEEIEESEIYNNQQPVNNY